MMRTMLEREVPTATEPNETIMTKAIVDLIVFLSLRVTVFGDEVMLGPPLKNRNAHNEITLIRIAVPPNTNDA